MAAREFLSDTEIGRVFVRHQTGLRINRVPDGCFQTLGFDVDDNMPTNLPATLRSRRDGGPLRSMSALVVSLEAGLPAHVCPINLDNSGELGGGFSVWGHRKANPIHKEQCGLVADLALTLDLQSRNAFLRRGRSPEGIAPVPKRNPRFLIHRAYANGVLFLAIMAAPQKS